MATSVAQDVRPARIAPAGERVSSCETPSCDGRGAVRGVGGNAMRAVDGDAETVGSGSAGPAIGGPAIGGAPAGGTPAGDAVAPGRTEACGTAGTPAPGVAPACGAADEGVAEALGG
jgi:hypothetical protein